MSSFEKVRGRIGFPLAVVLFWTFPAGKGEVQNLKKAFNDWLGVLLLPNLEPDLVRAVLEKMREVGKFPDWIAAAEKLQGDPRDVSLRHALDLAGSFKEAYDVFRLSSHEARGKTPAEMVEYYKAAGGNRIWQKAFKAMARYAGDFEQYHKVFQQAVQLCDEQTKQRFAERIKKEARTFEQKYRAYRALSVDGYLTERAEILKEMKEMKEEKGGTLENWAMVCKLAVPNSELHKLAVERMVQLATAD